MKVAIIINYWKNSPGGGGGIKTYIVNLTEELKKRGNIDCKVIFRVGEDMENYKIRGSKFLFPIRAFLALRKNKATNNSFSRGLVLPTGGSFI